MRRVVLGLVVMAILEAASYGTVLAISSVKPESLIVRSSRVTLYHSSDCVPYWMVWAHVSCPST